MVGLKEFVQDIKGSGRLDTMVRDPRAQFVDPNTQRDFLGAQLFPRQNKEKNEYKESRVQVLIFPARDNSPYSPPVHQHSYAEAPGIVRLGHIDSGASLTGDNYESMLEYFRINEGIGQQQLLNWLDSVTSGAMSIKGEIQCWELISTGQVTITIDNTTYTADYPAPAENRFNATGDWSAKTNGVSDFDPFDDLQKAYKLLWDAGFDIYRQITSNAVVGVMAANTRVRANAGYLTTKSGAIVQNQAIPVDSLALANESLRSSAQSGGSRVPPIETYDLNYNIADPGVDMAAQPSLSKNRQYFLPRNIWVVIGRTNQNYLILSEDAINKEILGNMTNTLGYTGVGKVPTYDQQGIITKVFMNNENHKLQGVNAESYIPDSALQKVALNTTSLGFNN
ncbi:MAG: major capsid protein [Crocosphaera sp.]|nr:hypothetical protein [Crocosphaera sp.]MCH2245702.1 major capsid protein [Crocosphaera sp.]